MLSLEFERHTLAKRHLRVLQIRCSADIRDAARLAVDTKLGGVSTLAEIVKAGLNALREKENGK